MKPSAAYLRLMTIASRVNRRLVEEKVDGRLAILVHPDDYLAAWTGMLSSGQSQPMPVECGCWEVLGIRIIQDEKAPRL